MAKTNAKKAHAPAATPEVTQEVTQETVATEAPTTTSIEPVQLTIADLQLLARIVDLASRRGAFQAAELTQVGEAYNKVAGFLAYVESVQTKPEEATAETEAPAAA
jgi:hypothetical protein